MVITLTDDMTKEEFQKKLAEMKPTKYNRNVNLESVATKPIKKFNIDDHFGKVKWNEDPMEFQKRMRNEWDRE